MPLSEYVMNLIGHPTPIEYWKETIDEYVKNKAINLSSLRGLKSLMEFTMSLSIIEIYNSDNTITCRIPSKLNEHIEFLKQYINSLHSS